MNRLAAVVVAWLALSGCAGTLFKPQTPPTPTAPASPGFTEANVEVFAPLRCGRITRADIQGQPKAQGALADVGLVAEQRGHQVDALSGQLARIAKTLQTHGCAEIRP